MVELALRLGLSEDVIEKLKDLLARKNEKVIKYAEKCVHSGFHHLKGKPYIFNLAVILRLACEVKEKYDELGIEEKIYYDTMADIKIWCEKTGNTGIENYGWLKNHVSFELFKLGRLQFQFYECKNKTLKYSKLPFTYGENLIYVHIPEGEKLDEERCKASFEQAKMFFCRYFPQYEYKYFFCESWLLFEGNKEIMAKDSNILKFMSLFDICYSVKIDDQAIERIFGKRKFLKKDYAEKTSLQKSAKQYMLKGKRLGMGIGVRKV